MIWIKFIFFRIKSNKTKSLSLSAAGLVFTLLTLTFLVVTEILSPKINEGNSNYLYVTDSNSPFSSLIPVRIKDEIKLLSSKVDSVYPMAIIVGRSGDFTPLALIATNPGSYLSQYHSLVKVTNKASSAGGFRIWISDSLASERKLQIGDDFYFSVIKSFQPITKKEIRFTIEGIFEAGNINKNQLIVDYEDFEKRISFLKGKVSSLIVKLSRAEAANDVSEVIDNYFEHTSNPTKSSQPQFIASGLISSFIDIEKSIKIVVIPIILMFLVLFIGASFETLVSNSDYYKILCNLGFSKIKVNFIFFILLNLLIVLGAIIGLIKLYVLLFLTGALEVEAIKTIMPSLFDLMLALSFLSVSVTLSYLLATLGYSIFKSKRLL